MSAALSSPEYPVSVPRASRFHEQGYIATLKTFRDPMLILYCVGCAGSRWPGTPPEVFWVWPHNIPHACVARPAGRHGSGKPINECDWVLPINSRLYLPGDQPEILVQFLYGHNSISDGTPHPSRVSTRYAMSDSLHTLIVVCPLRHAPPCRLSWPTSAPAVAGSPCTTAVRSVPAAGSASAAVAVAGREYVWCGTPQNPLSPPTPEPQDDIHEDSRRCNV
jgi:hypothetical protein